MHKYLNPKNYIRRLLYIANAYGVPVFEPLLEKDLKQALRYPPIFFLGAPRSGSTLAFQVVTDALDVGYISNCHCRWFGAPGLAERIFHPLANRPQSDYRSHHGITRGCHAPSECGEWWYRFFRRTPPYVSLGEVDIQKMQQFRRSVMSLTNAFNRPVVFKNLYASLRIQAIAHYLPESLFIVTHRNEVDNGHSLLEARYKRFGSYDPWFSVEPPGSEQLKKLPAYEQVIEQIRQTHLTINRDLQIAGVEEGRRFDLVYESLCDDPAKIINSLQDFFERNACNIGIRSATLPPSFNHSNDIRIDMSIYNKMASYAKGTGNFA